MKRHQDAIYNAISHLFHLDNFGRDRFNTRLRGSIAQSVEQRIENPRVPGSIPGRATTISKAWYFIPGLLLSGT